AWGQGWERIYPEAAGIQSVAQTADGGYIAAGNVESVSDSTNIYLLKTDADGNKLWARIFGGPGVDQAWAVIPWDDGGYIIAGTTTSYGNGGSDIYVLRTNSRGEMLWDNTYGGSQNDDNGWITAIRTTDGEVAIASTTSSSDGDIVGNNGNTDIWLLRINPEGDLTGSRCYGGATFDYIGRRGLQQTADNGFVLSGGLACAAGLYTPICNEAYIVKTNADGSVAWSNTYNGGYDFGFAFGGITATSDGGFAVACWVDTIINGAPDDNEIGLLKVNAAGDLQWFENYEITPGFIVNLPLDLTEAGNGDLLISCLSAFNLPSAWLLKTNNGGELLEKKSFGGLFDTYLWTIEATTGNSFVLGGFTNRDTTAKAYLIKTDTLLNTYTNTISGTIYRDNGNCHFDIAEQALHQWMVKAQSGSQTFFAVTDPAGRFSMLVDTGVYLLTVQLPNNLWVSCDTVQLTFDQFYQTADTASGVLSVENCALLRADIGTPLLRRCYDNYYHVKWCNEGTASAENARVELSFDTFLDVDTTSLPDPWTPLPGNTFSVGLGDVAAGACGSFLVKVTVNCDSTAIGETKCVGAHIFPDTLCSPPSGWDRSNIIVTARFSDDTLLFTIRNQGNGDMLQPAEYIIIEDIVLLHEGSFQLLAGQDTVIVVTNAEGHTWRLEAAQHPDHPFSQTASATLIAAFTPFFPNIFLQYPQDEASPFVAVDCHPIIGSWDPNDKQTFPRGLDTALHLIRNNTELEYLIRFQNTGTDTAFSVIIRDTLSPFLDPASARPGASSHPYQFEVVAGKVLKFTFDPIMLPDSNVNEAASHGFVQFSLRQPSGPANPAGTVIENRAAIYFDYNPPVITNMVYHTVAAPTMAFIRDTICDPAGADIFVRDTTRFSYFDVAYEIFISDTLYMRLDTVVKLGDTIFGVPILSPDTVIHIPPLISVNGCDSVIVIHITISANIPPIALPFLLYPNPVGKDLILFFTATPSGEVWAVEIYDVSGRLRSSYLPPPIWGAGIPMHLPVSDLPAGVYFLILRSPNNSWVSRFVKQN
ncbi:MAG: T9SS type A sorting domain-containing protein, partial [Thermoanaerobaculia bacterium]|nr:T9SS type A sorting domain-containing protein [Thermoanaerobaculia bacterium]